MESKVFAVGLIAFCIIQSSFALKCYQCDSGENPNCNSIELNRQQPQDCNLENLIAKASTLYNLFEGWKYGNSHNNGNKDSKRPTCLKTVYRNGMESVVSRKCELKYEKEDICRSIRASTNGYEFCGTCDQDGCNDANSNQLFCSTITFGVLFCGARIFF